MNLAYLITGGNIGDRRRVLESAVEWLNKECGTVIQLSSVYETAAWGKEDQGSFYNQALLLETSLTAEELMQQLLMIEEKMGRVRTEKYGSRIIDIDILFFNNEVIETATVIVPHPQMANRRFVLTPLTEVAENFMHPVLNKTTRQLLEECKDGLVVVKV